MLLGYILIQYIQTPNDFFVYQSGKSDTHSSFMNSKEEKEKGGFAFAIVDVSNTDYKLYII